MRRINFIVILLFFGLSSIAQQATDSKNLNISTGNAVRNNHTGNITTGGIVQPHQVNILNSSSVMFAPPANDNCVNATSIVIGAPCINGTTIQSSVQGGESFGCQGTPNQSVWYSFVATQTEMFVEIDWITSTGCYFSSAVYSGGCLPSTVLSCEDAAGGPFLNIHNLTGLTVGNTYYIQVAYTGGGPCGGLNGGQANTTGAEFCINVGQTVSCGTCNNPCGSMCIFATAPTVAQVTSSCAEYQLQSRLNAGQTRTQCYTFTSPSTSFSLQMIINTVGCSGGNVTDFQWDLYPSGCSGVIQSGDLTNLNATGLSIGSSYVLCYTWTAACEHNSVYPYMVATAPLPIELLYFNATGLKNSVVLEWVTASEINNEYFSVQRSSDGVEFNEIATIPGAGNSNTQRDYRFTDPKPQPGVNYYRIVQHDYDDQSSFSKTVAVRFNTKLFVDLKLNPVYDQLKIQAYADDATSINIEIITQEGKSLLSQMFGLNSGEQEVVIPFSDFSKGIYFVKVTSVEGTNWLRIVKL